MAGNELKLQVLLSAIDRVTGPMKKILRGTTGTARALKAARDQLKDLDRAQQQLQGFRKLKNEAGSTGLALKAAQQHVARLRHEMAAVDSPTRKAAAAYAKAEREATKLKHAHIAKLRALRDTRGALTTAGIETKKLGDHEQHLRTQIGRTNALIDKQQHKLAQLGRQNQRLFVAQRNFRQAQAMAGAAASGGATMIGTGATLAVPAIVAVKAYSSFQDAMTGVARQVRGARDDSGRLTPLYFAMGEAIKQMSERLPGTAEDIAAIVEAGARMGIQGKQNLLVFAETTAVMADAFELPVDEVGADMSTLANLYKIPIANIGKLGDAINWLDDNTLSKGGDIIDVMKRIAGTADMVGMSYQQAAALGSTFLSLGASREIAGTAGNAMIRELSIATMQPKRFRAGLDMLKLDAGALQTGMSKDATGTIIHVLEAIKALPEQQQLVAATRLFGKEYGDDAAKLASNLDDYRQQLALVNAAQSKGSMLRDAQARAGNLSAIWANTKDAARNLASELGTTLAPALNDLMRQGAAMARAVRDWVKANPALAGTLLKAAVAGSALLAVIGGVAFAVAGVLGPLALVKVSVATLGIQLGPALAKLGGLGLKVLPMLGRAFMILGRAMVANPIGIVLMLVAGLAYLVWKNWSTIGPALAGIWESVKVYAGAAWDWMKAKADWLWQGLKTIFAWSPLGLIVTHWSAIMAFLGGLWSKFKDIGANLLRGLVNGLLGGLAKVKETIVGIGSNVTGWFKAKLGIHSPSRVFAQLGDYTMQGLAGGLDRSQTLPIRSLTSIAGRLRTVGAGIAIGAAAMPAVAIDHRPPLSPTGGTAGAGSTVYNITINAPAGQPAHDIARLVRLELERVDRERAAKTRSRLGDYD